MVSLEEAITKFEGSFVRGNGVLYINGSNAPSKFRIIYLPQLLREEKASGPDTEIEFDVYYKAIGLRLRNGVLSQSLKELINTREMLFRLELGPLLHDPRYLFEHNRESIQKLDDNSYRLEINLDRYDSVANPGSKVIVDFSCESSGNLSQITARVFDGMCKEISSHSVTFDYNQLDVSTLEPIAAFTSAVPEQEENEDQPEESFLGTDNF